MAGKNRVPHHLMDDVPRGFHEIPPPPMRVYGAFPHPMALEEERAIQHDEIRRLLAENRHLGEDHIGLQRELAAAKDELHRLSQVIPKLRAEKEAQTRDLIEKGLKLENDLHATEPLKAEVLQLRGEAQKLAAVRQELSAHIQALSQDLARMQAENQQIPAMKADIDALQQELVKARTAFEYEKKVNMEQIEQKQAMEKNLVSMAGEVEKLRAVHSTLDKRRGPGVGSYGLDIGYPGALGDVYGIEKGLYGSGSVAAYENRNFFRR